MVARKLVVYHLAAPAVSHSSATTFWRSSPPARRLRHAQEWALENLSANLSVQALAKRAGMSERSFRRAFVEETGDGAARISSSASRIDAARSLFEEAQLSVQVVATRCGFESADNLRRAFVRRLGVSAPRLPPALPPGRQRTAARGGVMTPADIDG